MISKPWPAASGKSHPCPVLCSLLPFQPIFSILAPGSPTPQQALHPDFHVEAPAWSEKKDQEAGKRRGWWAEQKVPCVDDFLLMLELAHGPQFGACWSIPVVPKLCTATLEGTVSNLQGLRRCPQQLHLPGFSRCHHFGSWEISWEAKHLLSPCASNPQH